MEGQSVMGRTSATKQRAVRGQWTTAQRQQMVAESLIAGAAVQEVAHRHGVRPNLLSTWRRQQRAVTAVAKRRSSARFVAVRVKAVTADGVIEIDLSSGCVRVRGIVAGAMLREVLAAAR